MTKTYDIGDGRKTIEVPEEYLAILEADDVMVLKHTHRPRISIRIAVTSVYHPTMDAEFLAFDEINRKAAGKAIPSKVCDDKAYLSSTREMQQDGQIFFTTLFEVGYHNHFITMWVMTDSHLRDSLAYEETLEEVMAMIPTICDYEEGEQIVTDLNLNDAEAVRSRCNEVEIVLRKYFPSKDPLTQLQLFIDSQQCPIEQVYFWQSAGLFFGEYVRKTIEGFSWTVVNNPNGRVPSLVYRDTSIRIFPMTMICKRLFNTDEIDIQQLYDNLMITVEDLVQKGY